MRHSILPLYSFTVPFDKSMVTTDSQVDDYDDDDVAEEEETEEGHCDDANDEDKRDDDNNNEIESHHDCNYDDYLICNPSLRTLNSRSILPIQ
jgi:ABC-type Zn2+ transport system substrate-binding protein/surface adhesin